MEGYGLGLIQGQQSWAHVIEYVPFESGFRPAQVKPDIVPKYITGTGTWRKRGMKLYVTHKVPRVSFGDWSDGESDSYWNM